MQLYFDGLILPVDERRQSTVLHMPVAISICELRDTISQRLVEKFPNEEKDISSLEWIRYQFWPMNPYSSSALRHTGRFSIKFGIQIRHMRKDHVDANYVNALLQYVKKFCVQLRDHVMYISADDKAIIPVGEPGLPVATGVRGHNRSLVPASNACVQALDHDFHIHGIVPSVALFVSIPESTNDSFYQGETFVTYKDKVTQPSSPQRHAAELTSIVTMNFSSDKVRSDKPILVLVTDGGPDHRLTYASVKVALLSLFMSLDLDMIIAVRTCPYQSWTNLAERMSTLNLALQNVSLCRKEMSSEAESRLKGKKSLAEVRKEIAGNPTSHTRSCRINRSAYSCSNTTF